MKKIFCLDILSMPNHCSPSKKFNHKLNTCYDSTNITQLAIAFNKYIIHSPICKNNTCINPTPIDINQNTNNLYKELKYRLKNLCQQDFCWLDLKFIKEIKDKNLRDTILYFTFKPKQLSSKNTWFNTININEIMEQYQDLYKDIFKFLGAQPSDFTKIIKLNWKEIKNFPYIGIIFNTDPHNLPGTHWISIFIDNNKQTFDYFDSLGQLPNKNIASFLKHFKNYRFTFNEKTHQKGGSNCGVYSCYFIIQRLKGKSLKDINKKLISDNQMTKYRNRLFRPK